AADGRAQRQLAGFLVVKLTGRVAEIGLGPRSDLAGVLDLLGPEGVCAPARAVAARPLLRCPGFHWAGGDRAWPLSRPVANHPGPVPPDRARDGAWRRENVVMGARA